MSKTLQSKLKWRINNYTLKRRLFRKWEGFKVNPKDRSQGPIHFMHQNKTVELKNKMFTPKSKMDRSPTAIPQTNLLIKAWQEYIQHKHQPPKDFMKGVTKTNANKTNTRPN